jgi:DNA mismatch repair protein MutL
LENEPFLALPAEIAPMPFLPPVGTGDLPTFTLRQQTAFTPTRLDFGDSTSAVGTSAAPTFAPHTLMGQRSRQVPDTHGPLPEGVALEPAMSLDALRDLRPLGQLHDSFIIAAGMDGLWVIDQHVAHERILFEQVLRQMNANAVERQQLLLPIVLDLTPAQMVEFTRIEKELATSGFDAEPFGPRSIAVKAAPSALDAGQVERVIADILEIAEQEMREVSFDGLRRDMAASIACRAAIKINNPLDAKRMQWLLNELAGCEYPTSCPHGRPIALRYPTKEILKGFHRI